MKFNLSLECDVVEIAALLNVLLNNDDTGKKENIRGNAIATFERAAKIQAARKKTEQQQLYRQQTANKN